MRCYLQASVRRSSVSELGTPGWEAVKALISLERHADKTAQDGKVQAPLTPHHPASPAPKIPPSQALRASTTTTTGNLTCCSPCHDHWKTPHKAARPERQRQEAVLSASSYQRLHLSDLWGSSSYIDDGAKDDDDDEDYVQSHSATSESSNAREQSSEGEIEVYHHGDDNEIYPVDYIAPQIEPDAQDEMMQPIGQYCIVICRMSSNKGITSKKKGAINNAPAPFQFSTINGTCHKQLSSHFVDWAHDKPNQSAIIEFKHQLSSSRSSRDKKGRWKQPRKPSALRKAAKEAASAAPDHASPEPEPAAPEPEPTTAEATPTPSGSRPRKRRAITFEADLKHYRETGQLPSLYEEDKFYGKINKVAHAINSCRIAFWIGRTTNPTSRP
ncbi:hypothetical protein OPT61_g5154 [Boeremia exigua]|uniref:Uncharacterized protein n=1 Tax=Boeremia exigua TaxID=749465 RepID=A0ACC2IBF3_9PLEO|nr:hypothetical protein OPT61_g5154 [Boeremia exigua]